ncbi:hypothetical protein, partial [Thermoactinomyces daqus]|uniref:hypothetical protein n=1 Tax=Thermoactinomyces daqus TaxID=1329516 RepID=UPI001C687B0C
MLFFAPGFYVTKAAAEKLPPLCVKNFPKNSRPFGVFEVVDKEGQQPFLLKRYKKTFRRKVSMFRTNS